MPESGVTERVPQENGKSSAFPWWYPVGGQIDETGAHLRVWANERESVSVVIDKTEHRLAKDASGYFFGHVPGVCDGDLYAFLVDGRGPFPDPASRFQPNGPHGASQFIDAAKFAWTDHGWPGIRIEKQIVHELHVGTLTPQGTWQSAIEQLPALADLGVTVLEVMPVAEFAGKFGWGYDGVDLFAPTRNYGTPDEFRKFVDRAHALKLGVILDVVYNHLGPDGNYLSEFSKDYFTDAHKTDWGEAINFYGKGSAAVREFYTSNAAYWIKEFHLDGLRVDATQNIYDKPENHILAAVSRASRKAGEERGVILVGENEPQQVRLILPECEGGYGFDALWNDDFHHCAAVAATGKRDAYYVDYRGTSQELLSAVKYGFLYQGQWYSWQKQRRGTATFGIKPASMVMFLQNHDQIANSAHGVRVHQLASPGISRALAAVMLLSPGTPLLFQGQEFAASAPFVFFADHKPELAEIVRKGRKEFLSQWKTLSTGQVQYEDPISKDTFEKCKLDLSEREKNQQWVAFYKDLIALRKTQNVFSRQDRNFDGAVLTPEAFLLRFFSSNEKGDHNHDRLVIVNLGRDFEFSPAP